MQLENIVPQSEGNYERQVFSNEADAIAWMKSCNFTIDTRDFLNSLPK